MFFSKLVRVNELGIKRKRAVKQDDSWKKGDLRDLVKNWDSMPERELYRIKKWLLSSNEAPLPRVVESIHNEFYDHQSRGKTPNEWVEMMGEMMVGPDYKDLPDLLDLADDLSDTNESIDISDLIDLSDETGDLVTDVMPDIIGGGDFAVPLDLTLKSQSSTVTSTSQVACVDADMEAPEKEQQPDVDSAPEDD